MIMKIRWELKDRQSLEFLCVIRNFLREGANSLLLSHRDRVTSEDHLIVLMNQRPTKILIMEIVRDRDRYLL